MNYGLHLAGSGMLTAMHRMDVAANNLANLETAGFKADLAQTMQRAAARPEDGLWQMPSNEMLERLGGPVQLDRTRTVFQQGVIETTRNDLDVALEGEGFLVVQTPAGPRLTRDGRLTVNKAGELVQASTGAKVVGDTGTAITLNPGGGPVQVDASGLLAQGDRSIGRLKVVNPPDVGVLRKAGTGHFSFQGELSSLLPSTARVVQRGVERSSVDPVKSMLDISAAERSLNASAKIVQTHDEVLSRAIGTFGRVA